MTDAQIDEVFPVTSRNRVKRLHERGSSDRAAVFAILDAGLLCRVAYVLDGQPYCPPTIHWREDDALDQHGSSASRMLRDLHAGTPGYPLIVEVPRRGFEGAQGSRRRELAVGHRMAKLCLDSGEDLLIRLQAPPKLRAGNLSQEAAMPAMIATHRIAHGLHGLFLRLEDWLTARASARALYRMDDFALSDIALSRCDVERVNETARWAFWKRR